MTPTREEVFAYIHGTLQTLMEDWDDAESVVLLPQTMLFTELGLESLGAVVLGTSIQERFGVEMPFGQLYAELGEQQRDISLNEFVDFAYSHLAGATWRVAGSPHET